MLFQYINILLFWLKIVFFLSLSLRNFDLNDKFEESLRKLFIEQNNNNNHNYGEISDIFFEFKNRKEIKEKNCLFLWHR